MKINYTNDRGIRTTITLSEAIVDTWFHAKPEIQDRETGLKLLKDFVETTPRETGCTFVESVESFLLSEVREYITGLEIKTFSLEREEDGR